jgi:hypothetical protein
MSASSAMLAIDKDCNLFCILQMFSPRGAGSGRRRMNTLPPATLILQANCFKVNRVGEISDVLKKSFWRHE